MAKVNVVPATNLGRRRQSAKVDGGPAYQARREEIIAAASQVFLKKGYRATSFRDIAEAIGKDRASLYYYFESKQDLFRVATGAAVARNVKAAERVARGPGTPAEKLAKIVDDLLESYTKTDYPYMFIFLQEDVSRIAEHPDDAWAREVTVLTRRYERAVTNIIQQGIDGGDFTATGPPHVLTKAIIGMANWTHRWFRSTGKLTAEEIARIFSETFLHGVTR
jgi:AcrR family transcriptional regulator